MPFTICKKKQFNDETSRDSIRLTEVAKCDRCRLFSFVCQFCSSFFKIGRTLFAGRHSSIRSSTHFYGSHATEDAAEHASLVKCSGFVGFLQAKYEFRFDFPGFFFHKDSPLFYCDCASAVATPAKRRGQWWRGRLELTEVLLESDMVRLIRGWKTRLFPNYSSDRTVNWEHHALDQMKHRSPMMGSQRPKPLQRFRKAPKWKTIVIQLKESILKYMK